MFSTTQSRTAIIKIIYKIMKKFLFGLIATVFLTFNGIAQENNDFTQKSEFKSAVLTTKINKEVVDYKFNSLEEFNKGTDEIIQNFDFTSPETSKLADKCEVSITVTVEVSVGLATVSMSGTVTTTCAGAAAAAKRLRDSLIKAAMGG